jgi:two-component system, chemotaxis family, protein-glutamate methylesterase/glutaminase
MINVLLVDDNAQIRADLRRLLSAQTDITVVGEVSSGRQVVRTIAMLKPDVVLMDADMPGMDGFETTVEVMTKAAVPIIIVSASDEAGTADKAFRAMEAGAVALVALPSGTGESQGRREAEIVQTVRAMSEVRVVRRRQRTAALAPAPAPAAPVPPSRGPIDLIAIGASTGGPQTLQRLLAGLPAGLSAAVVVVQHITPDFQTSFVSWLGEATGLPVCLGKDGQVLRRGTVYVAPHPFQMGIDRERRIVLRDDPAENGLRPSVSYLFRSVAAAAPRRTAAVLLTGMGQDGARELVELRARGAITVAQDEASSIVHGMPGEAIRLGAAMYILPPDEIAALLSSVTGATDLGRRGAEPLRRPVGQTR